MDPIAPLLIFGAAGAAWATSWWRGEQESRRAILRRMLERVDGELLPGGREDAVVGRHEGRPLRLRLRGGWGRGRGLTGGLLTRVYPLHVELDLLHAPAIRLRIRRDEGLAAVEKALGLVRDVEVAGGDRFDRAYLVEAEGDTASPLASRPVREAVEQLLRRWPLHEVALREGKLVVRGAPDTVGLRELGELLLALDVLARAYDRRPGEGAGLAGRFLWVGGGDVQPRCPFCHDAIDGGLDLVACGACRTVLHAECHEENRGCPILGCGGRGADGARWAGSAKPPEAEADEGPRVGPGVGPPLDV
ncbi:MAG: PHD finger domain-containing protein [Planctomycetes bacterium]|nr:PHD finger domain-containing protein [Planctomycetota bacterium]